MMWVYIVSLILVLPLTHAHADDRAKQRAETRLFTQMEKYEAWQEEVDAALDELSRRAGNVRRSSGDARARAIEQYYVQHDTVKISQSKGSRILSRIRRACEQIAKKWPPEPPECQEELPELRRFRSETSTRRSRTYDHAFK